MSKPATAFALALPPRDSETPAYRWLYASLRALILEGRLRSGAKLPATRDLALQYGLSRGTIVSAFELLKSEGYLRGTIGSGTYVSKVLPDALLHVKRATGPASVLQRKKRSRVSDYGRRVNLFSGFEIRPSRAFRPNVPALDLFPTALWTQITARRWRRASMQFLLGCDPMGYGPLRDAVADHLSTSRGVKCSSEQIAIVSGVQEALDLTSRLLLNPGDRVSVENPGYPGARMAFEAVGARVSAVSLDDDGMIVRGNSLLGSRLVYVTPGHQFPLGITMSLSRRLELLEWARKSGALIFEDDYDSEYRFEGQPVPALQSLDNHSNVIFIGSFSKTLFPSLRVGYVVLPPSLADCFVSFRYRTDFRNSTFDQAVLCDFIVDGHLARHLRRMRNLYAGRLAALIEGSKQHLSGLLELSDVRAGLYTIGFLKNGMTSRQAETLAAAQGVEVLAVDRYTLRRPDPKGLLLGFAAYDETVIRQELLRLAKALS